MRISYSLQAIGAKVAEILIASGLNVAQWAGSNVAAPNVAGYPRVDIDKLLGTTVATPNVAGYQLVDTRYHRGTLENALIANRRDVNAQVVGDKTGYSLAADPTAANGIRQAYMQLVAVNYNAGATDTFDVALSSNLTDYTKATAWFSIQPYVTGGTIKSVILTSNSNLRIKTTAAIGTFTCDGGVNILERQ